MKILVYPLIKWEYINSPATYIDYMVDGIVHGLRKSFGEDVVLRHEMWHWFKDYPYKSELYGRGFTMFCHLDRIKNDNDDLEAKIRNQYFDKIIVPIHSSRFNDVANIAELESLNYPREKVAIIDGNDDSRIQLDLIKYGTYFKRELVWENKGGYGLYDLTPPLPICFGIPSEKISPLKLDKDKELSYIVPAFGGFKTYSFDNEADYYNEYATSKYAYTWKKGGWDCMRHYEIVANSCLPVFKDIKNCPVGTMAHWPKATLTKIVEEFPFKFRDNDWWTNLTISLYHHLKYKLTTESIAKYVLESMGSSS